MILSSELYNENIVFNDTLSYSVSKFIYLVIHLHTYLCNDGYNKIILYKGQDMTRVKRSTPNIIHTDLNQCVMLIQQEMGASLWLNIRGKNYHYKVIILS